MRGKAIGIGLTAATFAAMGSAAWGTASLTMIPPTGTDTTTSGRTVVWNGTNAIAVGLSGTGTGIVWDATNGSRSVISSDGAAATVMSGAGYRTVAPGVTQLVANGLTSSGHTLYTSMDNGLTWGPKVRLTNTYLNYTLGTGNTLGVSSVLEADGTNKAYFGFAWNQQTASSKQLAVVTASDGITPPTYTPALTVVTASTTSDQSDVQGVSGTGVGVGKRGANAYWVNSAGAKGTLNTLSGTAGQARAISNDGTHIFGFGAVTDGRTGSYPWMITGGTAGTATELPVIAGVGGNATNGVAYGSSADGRYASGMNYPGIEKAVIWDTNSMIVLDLTQIASDAGILGGFIRLGRAYSVVDLGNGSVAVTGEGAWTDGVNTYTRGFVMTVAVPEPATLGFLVLGGLALLRRRR